MISLSTLVMYAPERALTSTALVGPIVKCRCAKVTLRIGKVPDVKLVDALVILIGPLRYIPPPPTAPMYMILLKVFVADGFSWLIRTACACVGYKSFPTMLTFLSSVSKAPPGAMATQSSPVSCLHLRRSNRRLP